MIALACDHGAFDLKHAIMKHLDEKGLAYKDFGCYDKTSCDYPDFAGPAAKAVASGECDRGIVVCTTGIGVSITANKVKGIRCALLSDVMSARLTPRTQRHQHDGNRRGRHGRNARARDRRHLAEYRILPRRTPPAPHRQSHGARKRISLDKFRHSAIIKERDDTDKRFGPNVVTRFQ